MEPMPTLMSPVEETAKPLGENYVLWDGDLDEASGPIFSYCRIILELAVPEEVREVQIVLGSEEAVIWVYRDDGWVRDEDIPKYLWHPIVRCLKIESHHLQELPEDLSQGQINFERFGEWHPLPFRYIHSEFGEKVVLNRLVKPRRDDANEDTGPQFFGVKNEQVFPLNEESTLIRLDGPAADTTPVILISSVVLMTAAQKMSEHPSVKEVQIVPGDPNGALWLFEDSQWVKEKLFPGYLCVDVVQRLKNCTDHLTTDDLRVASGQLNVEVREEWIPLFVRYIPTSRYDHVVINRLSRS